MNIWAFIYLEIEAWRDHLIAQSSRSLRDDDYEETRFWESTWGEMLNSQVPMIGSWETIKNLWQSCDSSTTQKFFPLHYFMPTLPPLAKAIMVTLMLSIRTLVHCTNLNMKHGTLAHFCNVLMKFLMGLWAFLLCWPRVGVCKNLPSIPKS